MALKTPAEYVESLRDGRVTYWDGERIDDITAHPKFKIPISVAATDYEYASPTRREVMTYRTEEGELAHRIFQIPRTEADLERRVELMHDLSIAGGVTGVFMALMSVKDAVAEVNPRYAANIERMSPTQLGELSSIGVTAITVEDDSSITLLAAQAAALFDQVPISVQPGYMVYVSDTQADIDQAILDGLTPTTLAELASIGVQTIDVTDVTGAGPLTIDNGLTLSIDGPVPASQIITFTGTGGTLAFDDTADMAGTIDGFAPPDTIDMTDVPYDNSGNGFAQLGIDPSDG